MAIDLEKKYSLEELIALNEETDFPVEIGDKVICGFELLGNGRLSPMFPAPFFRASAIATLVHVLSVYASSRICPGTVLCSKGGFKFEEYDEVSGQTRTMVLAPNVSFLPRETTRKLDAAQLFTFKGKAFTPSFVIEVEDISRDSKFRELKNKILNGYFAGRSSVELAWIIDPEHRHVVEFWKNGFGRVVYKSHKPWKDLSGRNVLPGFSLTVDTLKYRLEKNLMESSSEDENYKGQRREIKCPLCELSFTAIPDLQWHIEQGHSIPAQAAKQQIKRLRGKVLSPRKRREYI